MVVSPLRFSFSLSVSTIPRAGRVGAQRLRVAWVYPNEYSADAWSARRGTPAAFAHIGKALNLQYINLSLDAKGASKKRERHRLAYLRQVRHESRTCEADNAVCGAPRDALAAPASVLREEKCAAKLRCHSRNVGVQRGRVALVGFPSA